MSTPCKLLTSLQLNYWKKVLSKSFRKCQSDNLHISENFCFYIKQAHIYDPSCEGKHRPTTTVSLRASTDTQSWSIIALLDASKWSADALGTYPFRHIESVTDPGFYRFYQIYAVHFDDSYLLLMNVGLWSPQKMSFSKWKSMRDCQHAITLWTTEHVIYWMSHHIKWGQNKEKGECMESVTEYEVTGKDLVKADKETLKYLKIQNPLMQQRILDARDLVLNDPQIVRNVITQCQKTCVVEMEQILKELEAVKQEVAELKCNGVESGELAFGPSWTNYEGHVMSSAL